MVVEITREGSERTFSKRVAVGTAAGEVMGCLCTQHVDRSHAPRARQAASPNCQNTPSYSLTDDVVLRDASPLWPPWATDRGHPRSTRRRVLSETTSTQANATYGMF